MATAISAQLESAARELQQKQEQAAELKEAMTEDLTEHMLMVEAAKRELRSLKRRISKRRQFLTRQRKDANSRVVLDVGGTKFTTTLTTLGDSVLAALFYSRVDVDEDQFGDGAVFIDRDPQAFASILQWLRTGVVPRVEKGPELQTLIHEASHYGLHLLVEELESEHYWSVSESGSEDASSCCSERGDLGPQDESEKEENRRRSQCGWIKISSELFLDLANRPTSSTGLKLNGCDLRGFDLYGMDLRRANFHRCNLSGVDLRRTKLDEACFVECCLRDADFEGATLCRADLSHADCYGANFRNATLKETNLDGADLRMASFSDASAPSSAVSVIKGTELDSDL